MSFCTSCGKQNDEAAKFCTGCGAVLKTTGVAKNKKIFYLIFLLVLVAGAGAYFIFFNDSSKNKPIIANDESKTNESPDSLKIENNKDNPKQNKIAVQRDIPTPLVPIIKAADVLPKWTENEDISGDHALIRLYIGAIGKKTIKLFITGVDTVNNLVSGYSIVGNNSVMFEGPFTKRERKASTNQANNQVDAPESIYKMTLFEPETININGVFQLEIHISDLFGGFGTGSWVSYDGKLYREVALDDTIASQMK